MEFVESYPLFEGTSIPVVHDTALKFANFPILAIDSSPIFVLETLGCENSPIQSVHCDNQLSYSLICH